MKRHLRAAEKHFAKSLKRYILNKAHIQRAMTEIEYIKMCKKLWQSVVANDVYAIKIFVEPLVDDDGRPCFSDKIHCVMVAQCDADGNVQMPFGYVKPDLEDVFYTAVCIGGPQVTQPKNLDDSRFLVGFFDIAGFKNLISDKSVSGIKSIYLRLISDVIDPLKPNYVKSHAINSKGELVPALMWCPIEVSYASDSIIIYAPCPNRPDLSPGFVQEFFKRCAMLFCASLRCGIPLRGAISYGPGVFDSKKRMFFGPPLVEASSLESKMDFIGVCLGKSMQNGLHIPITMVHILDAPLTDGGVEHSGGLVLDWPRVWRKYFEDSAADFLNKMCDETLPEKIRARYDHAIEFVRFSEDNSEWHNPEGHKIIEPDDWSAFSM